MVVLLIHVCEVFTYVQSSVRCKAMTTHTLCTHTHIHTPPHTTGTTHNQNGKLAVQFYDWHLMHASLGSGSLVEHHWLYLPFSRNSPDAAPQGTWNQAQTQGESMCKMSQCTRTFTRTRDESGQLTCHSWCVHKAVWTGALGRWGSPAAGPPWAGRGRSSAAPGCASRGSLLHGNQPNHSELLQLTQLS